MMIKKVILILALTILSFSLLSCQTVEGIGGDIQWSAQRTSEILEGQ
jgi:predicted small secreted protein